jgi:hypothetical protein
MKILILSEFICTSMLTGLIWTIQLINYPQLRLVGENEFRPFHFFHMNAITPLVAPLMILELFFCAINFIQHNFSSQYSYLSFFLLCCIWGTTFFLSVPLHEKILLKNKNMKLINKLVLTNWIRTAGWTLKLFLLILIFVF